MIAAAVVATMRGPKASGALLVVASNPRFGEEPVGGPEYRCPSPRLASLPKAVPWPVSH
ncbi:hypothetical protein [Streptomyces sp. NPDC020951]|uniref:hypothetical protein n=1 Tax=Streptomyces sp. NPDC020951 TaxID=3365104 RepID=UPI00379A6DCA